MCIRLPALSHEGLRHRDTPVAMSTLRPQTLALNSILQPEGQGLLGEMADSRAEDQDEPGILVAPESEEAPQNTREHDERHRGKSEGVPTCHSENDLNNKTDNNRTGL